MRTGHIRYVLMCICRQPCCCYKSKSQPDLRAEVWERARLGNTFAHFDARVTSFLLRQQFLPAFQVRRRICVFRQQITSSLYLPRICSELFDIRSNYNRPVSICRAHPAMGGCVCEKESIWRACRYTSRWRLSLFARTASAKHPGTTTYKKTFRLLCSMFVVNKWRKVGSFLNVSVLFVSRLSTAVDRNWFEVIIERVPNQTNRPRLGFRYKYLNVKVFFAMRKKPQQLVGTQQDELSVWKLKQARVFVLVK